MKYRNGKERLKGVRLSGGKCIICGWDAKDNRGNSLVQGAHVRSYESGPEFDNYDNIVAFCPNHHAEYDNFLFTIDAKTKRIVHIDKDNPINGLDVSNKIKHIKESYLAYNQYLFNKKNNINE